MAKRRSSVLSIITVISITGVALGVTALIVVLSVMGGFKKDLKEKIIGTKAHIVIQSPDGEPLEDSKTVVDKVKREPGVIGASPFVEAEVMVSSPTNLSGVILRGIEPEHVGSVSKLEENIEKGSLEYLLDDSRMDAELEKERSEELAELLAKVRKERDELENERDAGPARAIEEGASEPNEVIGPNGETVKLPSIGEDVGKAADENENESEGEFGDEGFMRPMFEEESETGESPDSGEVGEMGEMPSMFEEESEEDEKVNLPGLIIGRELARSLQVHMGQEVNVVTPNGEMGPMGPIPRSRPFKIVGVFYSGMYEYDANYAYTAIEDSRDFLNVKGVTGIEIKTDNVEKAPLVAQALQKMLGPAIEVLDWQQLNRSLFYALKLEKIAMFVVLTFIILVASFSIVAMLIMIVIEKGREIAILKAVGATNAGVMRTFIFQGTVIGIVGAAIGLILGLGICYFLSEYGFPLNSEVYYISTLPVDVDPVEIVMVVIAAIVISFLATIYPSIQAARLNPVEGLRDE